MKKFPQWPSWRYGPGGASMICESESDVPAGWQDHPSKVKGAAPAGGGTQTARQSANGSVSEATAAKTKTAKSQTATDPAKAAANVGGGIVTAPETAKEELDAHGHPWSEELHAATKTKTKEGLWRMKVGKSRPAPAEGFPLDL